MAATATFTLVPLARLEEACAAAESGSFPAWRKEHAKTAQEFEGILTGFNTDERRQHEANRKYWKSWLDNVDDDLNREPERVRRFYEVRSTRIEPLGIVYLVPASGLPEGGR